MQPRDFCYWLQGFMEIQNPTTISEEQVQVIKDHLDLVMGKKERYVDYTKRPKGLKPVEIEMKLDNIQYYDENGNEINTSDWFKNAEHPVSC